MVDGFERTGPTCFGRGADFETHTHSLNHSLAGAARSGYRLYRETKIPNAPSESRYNVGPSLVMLRLAFLFVSSVSDIPILLFYNDYSLTILMGYLRANPLTFS